MNFEGHSPGESRHLPRVVQCGEISPMNRREFIRVSAAACAAASFSPSRAFAEDAAVPLRLTLRPDRLGNKIGPDFIGLSYESAQLGNPHFFSGENTGLVGFVRRLGPSGVLRIGGNTSEYCYWTPDDKKVSDVTIVGPDRGLKAAPPVNITPLAIRNLRDFIDASGWKLIYGLNMGTGTAEDAAAEAAYVIDTIGTKLIAFQLCNEPDLFYRNGIRKKDYDAGQFGQEWKRFYDVILAQGSQRAVCRPRHRIQQLVAGSIRAAIQERSCVSLAALLCRGSANGPLDDHRAVAQAESQAAGRV